METPVSCELEIPVAWEPGVGDDARWGLALKRLEGLEALQAERAPLPEAHEPSPEARTRAQLDLVLDALREVHQLLRPLPPARKVSLSLEAIRVAGLSAEPGSGWLSVWVDARMPQPVWLPVMSEGEGQFHLRGDDAALSLAIDQLIFRLYRRSVARSRRAAMVEPRIAPVSPGAPVLPTDSQGA